MQVDPEAIQILLSQQPPAPQLFPAQQGCPTPPQGAHVAVVLVPLQPKPALHVEPEQQGWPLPPHATHWLLTQAAPGALHRMLPLQHA